MSNHTMRGHGCAATVSKFETRLLVQARRFKIRRNTDGCEKLRERPRRCNRIAGRAAKSFGGVWRYHGELWSNARGVPPVFVVGRREIEESRRLTPRTT